MNLLSLFLAFLLVLAVAAGLILLKHLHKKEAQLKSVLEPSGTEDIPSIPCEMSAIDQLLYDRCCRYMTEQRPFLVESFSLQDLANAVFTNKLYLSRTINRFSGKNFKNYVNYYRIMYAMELFRRNMCLHIAELAGLSGFRSETVFLRNFKSVMGEPPSQWCSRIRKKFSKNR